MPFSRFYRIIHSENVYFLCSNKFFSYTFHDFHEPIVINFIYTLDPQIVVMCSHFLWIMWIILLITCFFNAFLCGKHCEYLVDKYFLMSNVIICNEWNSFFIHLSTIFFITLLRLWSDKFFLQPTMYMFVDGEICLENVFFFFKAFILLYRC